MIGGQADCGSAHVTAQERSILERLVEGETNKEIATALGLSEQCVKYHVTKLMHRFGVDSRVTLAVTTSRLLSRQPSDDMESESLESSTHS